VIYALNTKNDEQEESIQALKDSHQEEIQHILAETEETVLQYESKVEEVEMLQRYIQDLETALEKHRRPKEEVSSKFATCRKEHLEDDPQARQESETFLFEKVGPYVEPDVGKSMLACNKDPVGFISQPLVFERNTWENQGKLSGIPCIDLQEIVREMVKLKWENQQSAKDCTRKSIQLQSSQEKDKALQQALADSCKEGHQRKNNGTEEVASSHPMEELAAHLEAKGQEISELKKYSQKLKEKMQVRQLKQIIEEQEKSFREPFKQQDVLYSNKEKDKVVGASHTELLNEVKKAWKKEYDDKFKAQQQSHFQEMQALEEKARKVLQSELNRMQKQQTLLIDSLRKQLSEQQVSSMNHSEVKEKLQEKLKCLMGVQKQQARFLLHGNEERYQEQIQLLKDELEKCQKEISELKKKNSLLKDAVDLLNGDVALQKQTVPVLQGRENQEKRLEEREEKSRKRTPRLEDLHLISCLQKKLNEKEEMIKELMKLKQKKMDEAAPSCIVTVPKLATYAKSFLSGELRPKRTQPQNIKSMVLDQNLGCVQVCCPSVLVLENRPLL
ncbi:hypothetical protein L345_10860, partial [Ophiophagus hannah]